MKHHILFFILFCMTSFHARAAGLPEAIQAFQSSFEIENAIARYTIDEIETTYPPNLLYSRTLLPQTGKYPIKELQILYRYSQSCQHKLPLNPLLTEPLSFTRALCEKRKLPLKWFVNSTLIHPGGGSYALRYAQHYPEEYETMLPFMNIHERPVSGPETLLGRLQRMPQSAIKAVIDNDLAILSGTELWIKKGDEYLIFTQDLWRMHLEDSNLTMHVALKEDHCYMQTGNICWAQKPNSNVLFYSLIALIVFNIVILFLWAYSRWKNRREDLAQRMLVLQILTHELRTPIASLSLTVEGFRREFEHLPESVYDEFRRLCEDSRRLRMLADASKDYLQSDHQTITTDWLPSVAEWLEFRFEEYQDQIQIELNTDAQIKVNTYWLSACIENLIKNACKYGVPPVLLKVEVLEAQINFEVIDQGKLTAKDWSHIRKAFVTQSGLGLGLTIVESMVVRMGGKIKLFGPPTTFKLEIPCETDITTR